MDAVAVLREAFERGGRRATLLFSVAFLSVGLASVLARQSLLAASLDFYAATGGDSTVFPFALDELRPVALAVTTSYPLALAGVAGLAVVHEYLAIVALRIFAAGEPPRAAATRRIVPAVGAGIVVGLVAYVAVLVGLVALVVPGLFLAVAFLFAHARVAVADDGPIEALRASWRLTAGRRLAVGNVLAALIVLYLTPRLVSGFVPGGRGLLVGGALVGLATVPSVALVAGAYARLEESAERADESEREEDPYARALGPEDLPEPE